VRFNEFHISTNSIKVTASPTSARVDFKLLDAVHEAAEEVGALVFERIGGGGLGEPLRAERGHLLGHPVVHHNRFVAQDYNRLIYWFGKTNSKGKDTSHERWKIGINKKMTIKTFSTKEKILALRSPAPVVEFPPVAPPKFTTWEPAKSPVYWNSKKTNKKMKIKIKIKRNKTKIT
jgi:hypothetical protein